MSRAKVLALAALLRAVGTRGIESLSESELEQLDLLSIELEDFVEWEILRRRHPDDPTVPRWDDVPQRERELI